MITLMIVLIIAGLLGLVIFLDEVKEMIGLAFGFLFLALSMSYDFIAEKISN
ncbi:hypothetical protein SAMN05192566_0744 [Methylophilus rhizosphaerae]|uniref:Uncharacterized protein n=1 Tax=Methylophilus rhizosphaerae TaxID=492660 RepID=A0A1G9A8G1_9PROT|nr:hypothetical protein [Methylophilus rhizosphaerae]SDK23578.1 hypothetical protein SAMN05192566_0744 [Methylophilus rhizosphaerae]